MKKRFLKKKTSKKKNWKEKKKKKRETCPLTRFELASLDEKNREKYWINPLDHASKPWKIRFKTGTYSISTMIDSFQELKFLGFLYNYGIFNWGCEWGQPTSDKGLKIFSDYRQNE